MALSPVYYGPPDEAPVNQTVIIPGLLSDAQAIDQSPSNTGVFTRDTSAEGTGSFAQYTYETGTNGALVTGTDKGLSGSTTATYQSTGAIHGIMGVQMVGTSAISYAIPGLRTNLSVYGTVVAAPASGVGAVVNFDDAGISVAYGAIQLTTADGVSLFFKTTTGISAPTTATSTQALAVGDKFRIDAVLDASSGITISLNIFLRGNIEGTVPDDAISSSKLGTNTWPTVARLSAASTWTLTYDTLRIWYPDTTPTPFQPTVLTFPGQTASPVPRRLVRRRSGSATTPLPDQSPPLAQAARRVPRPTLRPARRPAEPLPLVVVPAPPPYVAPSVRRSFKGLPSTLRRKAQVTPPQVVATPPLTYVRQPPRRAFKGWLTARRHTAEAPSQPQALVPSTARPRPRVAPLRRRRPAELPVQQIRPPAAARRRPWAVAARRRRPADLPAPQAVIPQESRRRPIRGLRINRRRPAAEIVSPQLVVTPPPYVPATFRRGIKGLQPRRRTRVEVVPPQVAATTPPPYVPGIGRRWLKGLQPRRRTKAEVTPAQQAATQAPKYVAQPPRRGLKGVGAPRHRAAEVPSPQAGPPAARTRRLGRPAPRRRRPVEVTPPQVTPTAPRYLPQPPAKHTLRGLPRRGRHVTPVHTHIPVHRGQPRRPVRSLPRRIIRAVANLVGIPTTQPPVTVLGYAETQRPVTYTEAQRPVTYTDTQQPVAYAEAQRPVTYTPVQLSVTFDQEALVHLSRIGVERYQPNPSTTPAISASLWEASFDGGTTWVAAQVVSGAPTWLVAGPAATSPGSATVLPDTAWVVPALRFANAPELIVRDATFDEGQRPPTIHLHD